MKRRRDCNCPCHRGGVVVHVVPCCDGMPLGLVSKSVARERFKWRLALCAVLGAFIIVWNYSAVRTAARWLIWSRGYKSKVLAQPASGNGELKHIEWDGSGWAGQNTTVFLVFDPTDSLSAAASSHQAGKFSGIPCEVYSVRRLESHWYTAQFYTNEDWHQCN
jgi:hypothetical protein